MFILPTYIKVTLTSVMHNIVICSLDLYAVVVVIGFLHEDAGSLPRISNWPINDKKFTHAPTEVKPLKVQYTYAAWHTVSGMDVNYQL